VDIREYDLNHSRVACVTK